MTFVIRRSVNEDIDAMIRLIMDVYDRLSPKEWFVVDEPAYTRKILESGESWGYVAMDTETNRLAGLFIANFPGLSEYNLAYDLKTSEPAGSLSSGNLPSDGSLSGCTPSSEFLLSVAHMDTAVVSPQYRGHHLQRRLMAFAENELKAAGYTRLMCTVHPDNRYSLGSALALGYQVMNTKEKYGGYLRHVLLKEI